MEDFLEKYPVAWIFEHFWTNIFIPITISTCFSDVFFWREKIPSKNWLFEGWQKVLDVLTKKK